jgi:AraC family transcriptional regulator
MRSGAGMKKHITDAMRQWEPGRSGPLAPLDWLKILPFGADAASNRRGWSGLEAARYRAAPASELHPPAMTHHRLVLFGRPSEELDLVYEGVERHVPPPAGAISLVPAGTPSWGRWSGRADMLHIYLEPGLVTRVAAEAFDLDPARLAHLKHHPVVSSVVART